MTTTFVLGGDVGGTKTNLMLCDAGGTPVREATFLAKDYSSLESIVRGFVASDRVVAACFGVAGPVHDQTAKITNLPWTIAATALTAELGGAPVLLINDLQATALGALVVAPSAFAVLQDGPVPPRATIGVIAPGTGLGEAALYHDGVRYHALPSEGGHASFAPTTDEEIELLRYLCAKHGGHVSIERILSGNGISDLYAFAGGNPQAWQSETDPNAAIADAGLSGKDPIAAHALELFAQILGSEAGNLALRTLATGGIVIGGGIPPKLLTVLERGALVERFAAKGRFAPWLGTLAVRVVLDPKAALLGAAYCALVENPCPN